MRKNSVLSFLFTAVLILMLCASCGGGGGGATLYNPENSPPRNEGVKHNWGAGSSGTTTGFTVGSGSSETLFSVFPPFFSPIDHIDMSLSINGGAPVVLNGLNASSTKDELPALSIGDVVTGTATITLQDGSTRPATLSSTTVGSETELKFAVQYKYRLQTSPNPETPHIDGTYYSASGINVAETTASSWNSGAGTPVSYWEADNGARYTGNVLSGFLGDITLTAKFAFGCTTPNNATIYRYCVDSTDTPVTASFSLSGGTGPYTVSCSSNVLSGTASGSTVNISIDSSFTGTLSNSFSAAGEPVTVTVKDDSTNETTTCTINVVDCVGDTTGIELNPNLPAGSLTLNIPADGKINGSIASNSVKSTAFDGNTTITNLTLPNTVVNTATASMPVFGNVSTPYVQTTGSFSNSSITTLNAPGLTSIGASAFGNSQITTLTTGALTSIGRYAFYHCPNLTSISLSSITTIGEGAFAECTSLSSITWWGSSGPSTIPRYAFYNTGLASVTIPSSVQTINESAFQNCANLTSVDLANVTSIGRYAFQNCTSLTSVDVSSATSVGADVFNGCSALNYITVKGDASIGGDAFKGCADGLTLVLTGPEAKIGGGSLGGWSANTINQCTNVTFDLSDCTDVTFSGGVLDSASDGFCTVSKVKLSKNITSLNIGNLDILPQSYITFTITVDDNSNISDFFSNFKTTVIHDDSNDNRNKAKCKFEINAGITMYTFTWNTSINDWDFFMVM